MASQTVALETEMKEGVINSYPIAASQVILKGAPVFIDASGNAFTNDGTIKIIAVGNTYVGIAAETTDSSLEDTSVRVYRKGVHLVSTSWADATKVSSRVYLNNTTDNGIFGLTSEGSGQPQVIAGEIVEYISTTEVRIAIDNFVGNKVANV